ncbi:MAG: linear amide C-N hydrolase [Anaerolineales bacterium]|nr:linear amide C-N hydrolase [Chloroflexota bacterium]MBL6983127.1 linear amide C-N hydrolase [Anaerolineales bacterium]
MKLIRSLLFIFTLLVLAAACSASSLSQFAAPTSDPIPTIDYSDLGLTKAEIDTLLSLEQVDEYPLYTMHYYAPYETVSMNENVNRAKVPTFDTAWGCALFAAFADSESMLFGRNFDWEYSPAVLIYTEPADGYASVSMVDIKYLGFGSREKAQALIDMHLRDHIPLLNTPYLPFDGFNETGLAVGMAAVPSGNMKPEPDKQTIDSLLVIREILDHASGIDEAVAIIESFNIDYGGGPPLHYMIADSSGQAVLVEFYQSEMHVIYNEGSWHQATNFLRSSAGESAQGRCWRYDRISDRLGDSQGQISPKDAMSLLSEVSQESTQWSIVYGMSTGDIHVVMGQAYDDVKTLKFELIDE